MTRPWQSEVPNLTRSVTDKIQFPTDEEADGLARIAWRGPSAQVSLGGGPVIMLYIFATYSRIATPSPPWLV